MPADTEEQAAAAALNERIDRMDGTCREAVGSMFAHLAGRLLDGPYPVSSMAKAASAYLGNPAERYSAYAMASEALDAAGYDGQRPDGQITGMCGAYALHDWLTDCTPSAASWSCVAAGPSNRPKWAADGVGAWLEAVGAAVEDGWRMGDGQMQLVAEAKAWLEAVHENENENEEEK